MSTILLVRPSADLSSATGYLYDTVACVPVPSRMRAHCDALVVVDRTGRGLSRCAYGQLCTRLCAALAHCEWAQCAVMPDDLLVASYVCLPRVAVRGSCACRWGGGFGGAHAFLAGAHREAVCSMLGVARSVPTGLCVLERFRVRHVRHALRCVAGLGALAAAHYAEELLGDARARAWTLTEMLGAMRVPPPGGVAWWCARDAALMGRCVDALWAATACGARQNGDDAALCRVLMGLGCDLARHVLTFALCGTDRRVCVACPIIQ